MAQLYAVCRAGGALSIRHVQLTNQLQNQIGAIFQTQEDLFNQGISSDVEFNGDWTPDPDELLVIDALPEAQLLIDAANQNAVALPVLDVNNFDTENIRGLFVSVGAHQNKRLLLQNFSARQLLSSHFTLLHDGNVFRQITEPGFSLDTHLVATIDSGGALRFKSFSMLRRVLDINPVFHEATDAELGTFCQHGRLSFPDAPTFIAEADEGIRKLVHRITQVNVLELHSVAQIRARGGAIGFPITVVAGRISIPQNRKEAKTVLSFLLNRVYRGPIDQQLLITNSVRPL